MSAHTWWCYPYTLKAAGGITQRLCVGGVRIAIHIILYSESFTTDLTRTDKRKDSQRVRTEQSHLVTCSRPSLICYKDCSCITSVVYSLWYGRYEQQEIFYIEYCSSCCHDVSMLLLSCGCRSLAGTVNSQLDLVFSSIQAMCKEPSLQSSTIRILKELMEI